MCDKAPIGRMPQLAAALSLQIVAFRRNKVQAFINRNELTLSLVGAGIALLSFGIREELGQSIHDQIDGVERALSQHEVRMDTQNFKQKLDLQNFSMMKYNTLPKIVWGAAAADYAQYLRDDVVAGEGITDELIEGAGIESENLHQHRRLLDQSFDQLTNVDAAIFNTRTSERFLDQDMRANSENLQFDLFAVNAAKQKIKDLTNKNRRVGFAIVLVFCLEAVMNRSSRT